MIFHQQFSHTIPKVHILSKNSVCKSNSGFLAWKTIKNHLLGWLTFYRLGWVRFYRYQKFKVTQSYKVIQNYFLDQKWSLKYNVPQLLCCWNAFLECQNQLLLAVSKMQNEASNFRCYVVPLFNWISKFAQAIMKTWCRIAAAVLLSSSENQG